MKRHLILGAVVAVLAALIAVPAEAAEWCLDDPALTFAAPHASHMTLYATEGVQGTSHAGALKKAHITFRAKPGKRAGTMDIDVHSNIRDSVQGTFATLLIVSSQPFGAGTVYGMVVGNSGHDMHVSFNFSYPPHGS
jgi:hypothetical protein